MPGPSRTQPRLVIEMKTAAPYERAPLVADHYDVAAAMSMAQLVHLARLRVPQELVDGT